MTWAAPLTAVLNATLTAAQWNATVRDDQLETAPAKATTAGAHFVSTAANAIAQRLTTNATILATQATASTGYVDLATAGPSVTVTTGTVAIALYSAEIDQNTDDAISKMSVAVSGATTVAASDDWAVKAQQFSGGPSRKGGFHFFKGLTAGSNVFTIKYAVGSNAGSFGKRELIIFPL